MKKSLMVAAGLAVLSTSAYATKARMQALGWTNVGDGEYVGSRTYSDTRSVFKNPAYVNEYTNYVVTEWGSSQTVGAAGGIGAGEDSANNPEAEGGFFRSAGNFNYGLYFGGNHNNLNCARAGVGTQQCSDDLLAGIATGADTVSGTGEAGFLQKDNVLDLFFGGDAGVQWGVNVQLARGNDEQTTVGVDKDHFSLGISGGVLMGALDAYLRLNIIDRSQGGAATNQASAEEAARDEWKRDFGITAGLAYAWRGHNFFAEFQTDGFEHVQGISVNSASGSAALVAEADSFDVKIGWGKTHKVSDSARIYTDAMLRYAKVDFSAPAHGSDEWAHSRMQLPIIVGFEADATSWLTLRGSVSYRLFDDRKNSTYTDTGNDRKISQPNTVDVAAGATLNFGKLKVDGMIGTTNTAAAGRAPATDTDAGAGAGAVVAEQGIFSLDNLMSRVAVHYWF